MYISISLPTYKEIRIQLDLTGECQQQPVPELSPETLAEMVKAGHNIRLVCFCKPKPCHGDILKSTLEDYIREEK